MVSDEQSPSTNGYPAPADTPPSIPNQPSPISAVPSPHPSAPAPAHPAAVPPVSAAPAAAPVRRKRSIFRIVVIALVAFIMVGGVVGYVAYDRATAIDRSTPGVVVDQFLQAVLEDVDVRRVALFVCRQWSAEAAMNEIPQKPAPEILVSWGNQVSQISGGTATVTLDVEFDLVVDGRSASDIQRWQLSLVDQSGWRVCGFRGDSLNP